MDSLFDGSHAVQIDEPQNYRGKLLILRAESLKEEFRTPENQLFLASGGFGCDHTAIPLWKCIQKICTKTIYASFCLIFCTFPAWNGCNASGRKVFGCFLSDGEETHFYRSDFVGIIADEHIPDWAKEKLEQLASQNEEQKNAPENNINLNM